MVTYHMRLREIISENYAELPDEDEFGELFIARLVVPLKQQVARRLRYLVALEGQHGWRVCLSPEPPALGAGFKEHSWPVTWTPDLQDFSPNLIAATLRSAGQQSPDPSVRDLDGPLRHLREFICRETGTDPAEFLWWSS